MAGNVGARLIYLVITPWSPVVGSYNFQVHQGDTIRVVISMSVNALRIALGEKAEEVIDSDEKCLQLAAEAEAVARYAAQNLDQR